MEVDYIHANHFLPVSRRASSLSVTPSNFQEIAHSFVHIKSTELQEIETTVATFRWYPKVGTRTKRNLCVAPGNQQLRRKVKLMLRYKKIRSEISHIKNQLTQPTHLVGGNRGFLEFKLAKVEEESHNKELK